MEFKKITIGSVVQSFDDDGNCVGQDFIASDLEVEYEDLFGDTLPPEKEKLSIVQAVYQPFDMVQPDTDETIAPIPDITITVKGGLIQDVDIPEHLGKIRVVVKDYDTDGFSEGIKKDDDGEYVESEWV